MSSINPFDIVQKQIDKSFAELEKTVRLHGEKNAHFEKLLDRS